MAVAKEEGGATILRGVGVSPGIVLGRALVLEGPHLAVYRMDVPASGIEAEVRRFRSAVRRAWRQLRTLCGRVQAEAGESYARVFEAQILILKDRALLQETLDLIRRERVNAEWAFRTVVGRYTEAFARLVDPGLRERGTDIEDVEARVQAILTGSRSRHDLAGLAEDVIVVSPWLSPSDAAGLDRGHVVGLAIDGGGPTSHTAIIASALGIPAVAGLRDASRLLRTGDLLVLDGSEGVILKDPTDKETAVWRERQARLARRETDLLALRDLPAVTRDGVRVRLLANIELPEEMRVARLCGAEGVGLYRSEYLYLTRAQGPPGEEELYRVYRDLAESALPHDVVIRSLDLGGEEQPSPVRGRPESNPVLGLRAIRLCLKHEELFRTQLRAIFRAAAHGGVRLMFPMVSGLEELRRARAIVDSVRRDLEKEGVSFAPEVPLGIMIEVPAAALIAERLAREVDFFSIGTNDLIQYALAIDRGNEAVAYLYEPLHPAILVLIRRVAEAAGAAGVSVSVCGEMAANPVAVVVLLGLGITELSMNPASIPPVKNLIRGLSIAESRAAVEEALRLDTAAEVDAAVRRRIPALSPTEANSTLKVTQ
jgi:phosphoenolpyruvate-protein phosphotransferase (PTS system enzyme I)